MTDALMLVFLRRGLTLHPAVGLSGLCKAGNSPLTVCRDDVMALIITVRVCKYNIVHSASLKVSLWSRWCWKQETNPSLTSIWIAGLITLSLDGGRKEFAAGETVSNLVRQAVVKPHFILGYIKTPRLSLYITFSWAFRKVILERVNSPPLHNPQFFFSVCHMPDEIAI